jgi:hypothetical protein
MLRHVAVAVAVADFQIQVKFQYTEILCISSNRRLDSILEFDLNFETSHCHSNTSMSEHASTLGEAICATPVTSR